MKKASLPPFELRHVPCFWLRALSSLPSFLFIALAGKSDSELAHFFLGSLSLLTITKTNQF
jgi:hypothetical protein